MGGRCRSWYYHSCDVSQPSHCNQTLAEVPGNCDVGIYAAFVTLVDANCEAPEAPSQRLPG